MPGPFYFSWIASGSVAFNSVTHAVEDVDIVELSIEHAEGDFPSLRMDVKNPRVGLLAPGRSVWAWLSWFNGTTIVPLFKGRLVGVPEEIHKEVVRLMLVARPEDYAEQQSTLAETLRVEPYWDPAWISADLWEDPDAVLEARTQLWHIDRTTHVVTVSDLLVGEDGTESFAESEHVYDDMSITYGQTPVRKVHVEAVAQWSQYGAGRIDMKPALERVFYSAGAPNIYLAASFSGDGLSGDWPKAEARIGGGWTVGTSSIARVDGVWFQTHYQEHPFAVPDKNQAGIITGLTHFIAWYPLWEFNYTLQVDYEATRQRFENLTFDLVADVQSMLTDPGDEEIITLQPKSSDLSLDARGEIPIGNVGRRAYLPTDRGRRSVSYLVMLARSHLLMRSRAVEVKFTTTWARGLALSCRKSAVVHDSRLSGGLAAGKIIAYTLSVSGDSGAMLATVTIGCTVGRGNTVTGREGTPTYVAEGYANQGYQFYDSQDVVPVAGQVAWFLPSVPPNDDGVDFGRMNRENCVQSLTITGGPSAQRGAINALPPVDTDNEYEKVLSIVFTRVHLHMRPVTGGPFTTEYALDISQLMVPKTIDLEFSA